MMILSLCVNNNCLQDRKIVSVLMQDSIKTDFVMFTQHLIHNFITLQQNNTE